MSIVGRQICLDVMEGGVVVCDGSFFSEAAALCGAFSFSRNVPEQTSSTSQDKIGDRGPSIKSTVIGHETSSLFLKRNPTSSGSFSEFGGTNNGVVLMLRNQKIITEQNKRPRNDLGAGIICRYEFTHWSSLLSQCNR